jgi:hypothetical protein
MMKDGDGILATLLDASDDLISTRFISSIPQKVSVIFCKYHHFSRYKPLEQTMKTKLTNRPNKKLIQSFTHHFFSIYIER